MANKNVRVVWYLTCSRQISKIGAGPQQIFATLSPDDRWSITMDCLYVRTYQL